MHHIASSLISFFLSPFNWIWILLLLSSFIREKTRKKICRVSALLVFLIFSNQWILDWVASRWQPEPVLHSGLKKYSCGIVLGGFGSPDANGNGYFNENGDRFIEAEKMYKLGIIQHILISGGNGKTDDATFREAEWAKNEFKSLGIPDSAIFIEDRSKDTQDNAAYAKKITDSLNFAPPYLLITSAIHMPRAALIFGNAGIPVQPFPCSYTAGRGRFEFSAILPQAFVLTAWDHLLKEMTGYIWYSLAKKKNN
ncbi:MAG TPA: YdcF family protein [Chitinophagaceae bacterium]|nr:YdcF family protein [Chitinophagaceae bacterium]